MNTLITVLHVLAAFCLILTVLLQAGKGAAMGSGLGGGGGQAMFGSSGAGNFLTKLTTGIAILFMVTSLTLATISNKNKSSSVIQGIEESVPENATESKAPPDPFSN
mgnify:FL=1